MPTPTERARARQAAKQVESTFPELVNFAALKIEQIVLSTCFPEEEAISATTGEEESLHAAICNAVMFMNGEIQVDGNRKAHSILRHALVDYADRVSGSPVLADKQEEKKEMIFRLRGCRCGHSDYDHFLGTGKCKPHADSCDCPQFDGENSAEEEEVKNSSEGCPVKFSPHTGGAYSEMKDVILSEMGKNSSEDAGQLSPPERIWIRPASVEYSTVPLNYDNDDIEYVRADLAPSPPDTQTALGGNKERR